MSPRRRSDPGKDVRLERLQNILGMAFVAIGLPVRMPLARHFLEGPARRLSLGARVDTVRQYASRLQMASAGVGETHIRVYPERQGLLLAGVAVVVAPAAAAGRNAQRACALGFTCVFFSFRDGLEPSENVNWRRERDSNPRRAFDPYTLSRGAPSTTRPSLRIRFIRTGPGTAS